ncbi:transglycosylase SLT domain-containing protein [Frigidibacter sp. ROC022]|uniref:transglycosylase SLT domain-containing protein n=1 Tax=Frigidibacter sp. ROC022 TaxID=2971796 RepID=UPI00215AB84A|nr:transglycosylase SLT domain-containing protein [Frigidibacter sp. ROC022]MCR8725341.1 transglycosylase SLT domain-containing protein [Frigidibacter sp. ROC022]
MPFPRSGAVRAAMLAAICAFPTACAPLAAPEPEDSSPAMRWDHRPEAERWTNAAMLAMQTRGTSLLTVVPTDIDAYCPGYEEAGPEDRAAFWAGLFSAIAKYESTWNPKAKGGGGLYFGLLQILPSTARSVGCDPGELLDGAVNLNCAVRIADRRVRVSDGTVASITADWGPMHWADKRAEMAAWTREQDYCQAR